MDTDTMRYYYANGLWNLDRLDKLLAAGRITQTQYEEITQESLLQGEDS